MIHKTVIIDKTAIIDKSVEIKPYAIIGKDVKIGKNTVIGPYSYMEYAEIGENCNIFNNVTIGTRPQDMRYKGQKTKAIIANDCTIREFTTIHRGSHTPATKVGNKCYLMAYSHVAHDCVLGNEIWMANCATLGGHVEIEDSAIVGGLVAIHQFIRIGKLAMLGGGAMVSKDVLPFMTSSGDRAKLYGLNSVGLRRHGYTEQTIKNIKRAYHILFGSKMLFTNALEHLKKIHQEENLGPEVNHMIEFVGKTKRGICHPAHKKIISHNLE